MALTPVVPLPGWPALRPVNRSDSDITSPACVQIHQQEAATRAVRRRSSTSRRTTRFSLLWGMALLGLLLLPSNYRAGAESAHAHSLIQLWAEATNGTVRHHIDHGPARPSPGPSSSWFDPAVGDTGSTLMVDFDDEHPDAVEHQESAPASSGVHLLLIAMTAVAVLDMSEPPIAVPDRQRSGLSPPILVPPPR